MSVSDSPISSAPISGSLTATSYTLSVESGSFNITGNDIFLNSGKVISLEPGSFVISGMDIELPETDFPALGKRWVAQSGSTFTRKRFRDIMDEINGKSDEVEGNGEDEGQDEEKSEKKSSQKEEKLEVKKSIQTAEKLIGKIDSSNNISSEVKDDFSERINKLIMATKRAASTSAAAKSSSKLMMVAKEMEEAIRQYKSRRN